MSIDERRIAPREATDLEAAYEDAERQVFLHTRDLSESGVYLYCPDPPDVGAEAHVVISLPDEHEILRLRGRVTRREVQAPRGFAMRFASDEIGERSRRSLRAYLAHVRSSST